MLDLVDIKSRKELNLYKSKLNLSNLQKEVLVGGLLGDLSLRLIGFNCRLVVEQKNKDYLFHLYEIFKDFTRIPPKERLQKRLSTSNYKSTWYFSTISHKDFTYYYKLFYNNKIKIIPYNIQLLLTNVSMAYWFMDDGSKKGNNYVLYTCSFTLKEHEYLQKILKDKFKLSVSIQGSKYKFLYIIAKDQSNLKFLNLIKPYIIYSMSYKL